MTMPQQGAPAASVPAAERVLLASYSTGGVGYFMYSDQSIEAEMAIGRYRFNSMDELRRFIETQEGGVKVSEITVDQTPPVMRYDPGHPDADGQGYVAYPSVNPYEEMVEMMGASRSYQLNAAAIRATKQMIQQSLDLLKT